MSINGISGVSFKGHLIVADRFKPIDHCLESDKILGFSTQDGDTVIEYDIPQTVRHNGHTYTEPSLVSVKADLNTVLNAYNAIKDTGVTVNLTK